MTLAEAPEPEVIFVVPAVVVTDPPETVTLDRSMAVIRVPLDATAPVWVPPVRFAVPDVKVIACRLAFAVRFPPLIVVVPPTSPPLLIVVVPPVRVAKSVILATLVTVPLD